MLRKINTIEDVKIEVMRYFETLAALPKPKRPDYARNYMWLFIVTEGTPEDAENPRFCPTNIDIADCWYMDANFMCKITRFEYDLLSARMRERPTPWKIVCRKLGFTRQMLDIYQRKALEKLFNEMKSAL
jgi:hypothetical protein|uniref:Uncharacterized protein n=1 Tax=virus sp. ctd0M1 TaxID=2827993 RepID=A0A8S5RDI8_9VIRU|nr:MAG TPA: hypothetical protein [virus sp. ctd0M1]